MKAPHLILQAYPEPIQNALQTLRQLIHITAQETKGVGKIEEAPKCGRLSFLPPETGSGSTIRIDAVRNASDKSLALTFHLRKNQQRQQKSKNHNHVVFVGSCS